MRNVDRLFERYGEFHRNPTNKAIHWVCVPLIVWSLLGMLWAASPIIACVAAWIGQFIGHVVERRKPAFAEDIRSLLVGPAWLLGFAYKRFGIAY